MPTVDEIEAQTALEQTKKESRKSQVRVLVTYIATGFVFLGSVLLITWCMFQGDRDTAKDLFLAVLPVATGIVTYWFADRSRGKKPDSE